MEKRMAQGSLLVVVLTGLQGLQQLRISLAASLLSYLMVAISWAPFAAKVEPEAGVASLLFGLTVCFAVASFLGLLVGHLAAVLLLLSFVLVLALLACLHERRSV